MSKTFSFYHAITNGIANVNEYVVSDNTYAELQTDKRFAGTKWDVDRSGGVEKLLKKFRMLNTMRAAKGLLPAVMVIPLSACGGGGESAPEVSGRAIDGYLGGSKVFLDGNPDVFVLTSSEAGQQGIFTGLFGTGAIVVQGGIDTSTGKEFTGELRAPEGAKVVTPLTTIVEAVVRTAIERGEAPVSAEEASAKIAAGLGLSADSDLLTVDFIAEDSGGTAKAAAQVASVLSLVTAAGGTGAAAAAIEKVAEKITVAAEAGVKSTVLTNTAQLTEVLTEVANEGDFVAANESVDIFAMVTNIAEVVQVVNAKIEVATSVKDILATQSAVQEDFVASFKTGVVIEIATIDAIVEEAVAEVEAYFEELAELGIDTGIDVEAELVLTDVDLDIIEEIIEEIEEDVGSVPPGDTEIGPQSSDIPDDGKILNFNTGIIYTDFQIAIDEATADDILVLGSGRFNADVKVDKSLSIYGANFDEAINTNDSFVDASGDADASGILFDTQDGLRANNESWIDGSITVMADDVTLNGLRLHSYEGALQFRDDDIDNFTLKHSYVTGFEAQGALAYSDDYDDDSTNNDGSTGWVISDNLIGGVAGGVGGSMYLDGLADSEISGNIFWRPGAAHVYADNLNNVEFNGNFFYHGLHAGGANFDTMLSELRTMDNNYGYVGFNGGQDGYGYGFGYGGADGYGMAPAGYGGYAGGYGLAGYGGYGYGYGGYGGGYGGEWDGFFGRNYWIELKGDQTDVDFIDNVGQFNSGGIQFWDEGIVDSQGVVENVFTDIEITGNLFQDFINADPGGNLVDAGTRHKSGLVSAIVWETHGDSTSSNLYIGENIIRGSIDEIYNYDPNKPSDLVSLIDIKGGLTNLMIDTNDLSWTGDLLASNETSNKSPVITQGIHLAGEIQDFIFLLDNKFDTDVTSSNYGSVALAINAVDYDSAGFGELDSANFNSSVDLAWADWITQNNAEMTAAERISLFGGDGTAKNGFYVITGNGSYGDYAYKLSDWTAAVGDSSLDSGDFISYLVFDDQTPDFNSAVLTQLGLLVDDVKPTASSMTLSSDANSDRIINDATAVQTLTFKTDEAIDTTKAQLVELGTVGSDATNFAIVAATNGAAEDITVSLSGMDGSKFVYEADITVADFTDGVWGLRLVDPTGNIYDAVATDSNYDWPVLSANTIQIDTTADNGGDLIIEFGGNGSGGTVDGSSATNAVDITGVDDDAMSVVVSAVDSNGAVIAATTSTYLRDTSNGNLYLSTDGTKAAVDLSALNIDVLNNKGSATGPYSAKVVVTDLAGNTATAGSDKSADGGNALSLVLSGEGSDDTYAFFETQSVTVALDGIDGDVNKITTYGIDGATFLGALKTFADSSVAQYQSADIDTLTEIKAALADWQLAGEASTGVLKFQNLTDNSVYATFDLATTGVVSSVDTTISHSTEADNVSIDLSSFATASDVPIKVFAKAEDDTGNIAYVADDISNSADIISVSELAASVAENAYKGTQVGQYDVTAVSNATLVANDYFAMDGSGNITVKNHFLLDYEAATEHELTVNHDGGSDTFKIGVTDVTEKLLIEATSITTGGEITFEIYLPSAPTKTLAGMNLDILYDPNILSYVANSGVGVFAANEMEGFAFIQDGLLTDNSANAAVKDLVNVVSLQDTWNLSGDRSEFTMPTDPIFTFKMQIDDVNSMPDVIGFSIFTDNTTLSVADTAGESLTTVNFTVPIAEVIDVSMI